MPEAHHGLDASYRDCLAPAFGPPAVCARARAVGRPVTVADVAADPGPAAHPVGRRRSRWAAVRCTACR
ncbi:hypothetical protein SRB17_44160 [Streptomyces sp. RB17]|uniref:hypothetical protein n=1 Tax=Streptomyces sp. RB17 TaxID=2585197 RepID=UPI001294C0E5|nr:hypothetical protein [Streptomyces sp. RB17]MQY36415.1 hypothetical protein [Streptomyces sp. RB17]